MKGIILAPRTAPGLQVVEALGLIRPLLLSVMAFFNKKINNIY